LIFFVPTAGLVSVTDVTDTDLSRFLGVFAGAKRLEKKFIVAIAKI